MTRTTISLPDDLALLLRNEAKRRGRTVSDLVRTALITALLGDREAPRQVPWAGIVDDPDMIQGTTIDEALSRSWAHDLDGDRR